MTAVVITYFLKLVIKENKMECPVYNISGLHVDNEIWSF